MSALPALPDEAVSIAWSVTDWRSAILHAGELLVRVGATAHTYGEDMVRVVEEHGPYIVIAPGLALAHARPGSSVYRDSLAVLTLAEPIEFGHPHHDPVRVVVGLAGATNATHLTLVAELANIFNDPNTVTRLADATSPAEVRQILGLHADLA